MSNPFASPSSSMDAMLPLMMMSMQQSGPAKPAPSMAAPTGTQSTFKTPATGSSFAGTPPVAPTQQQIGGKTLLGQ